MFLLVSPEPVTCREIPAGYGTIPNPMSTAADLLAALDASSAEAVRLAEPLSEEQFRWQPSASAWSVGHCLAHLAVGNHLYVEAMRSAAANGRPRRDERPLEPGFAGRWFIREMEPPPKRRLPAPPRIVPHLLRPKTEVMAEFLTTHSALRDFAAASESIDVNRTRFVNPFLKMIRFSLATGLLVSAAHERRHLWQANNVVRMAGFPRATP